MNEIHLLNKSWHSILAGCMNDIKENYLFHTNTMNPCKIVVIIIEKTCFHIHGSSHIPSIDLH